MATSAEIALAAPGLTRLRMLFGAPDAIGPDTVVAIVEEAAKFSQSWLGPLNPRADREGCRLDGGRVRTAAGHKAAWGAYLEAGWLGIDQPLVVRLEQVYVVCDGLGRHARHRHGPHE